VCLFAKTIEEIKFYWPKIAPTRVQLNLAQPLALIDRLDWTKVRPVVVKRPWRWRRGGYSVTTREVDEFT
jgi:transposase